MWAHLDSTLKPRTNRLIAYLRSVMTRQNASKVVVVIVVAVMMRRKVNTDGGTTVSAAYRQEAVTMATG